MGDNFTGASRSHVSSGHHTAGSNDSLPNADINDRPAKRPRPLPPPPPRCLCGACKLNFTDVSHLRQHLKDKSDTCDTSEQKWECSCGQGFTREFALNRHAKNGVCMGNRSTDALYVCDACDRPYYRLDNLRKHQKKGRCGRSRQKKANPTLSGIQQQMFLSLPTPESQGTNGDLSESASPGQDTLPRPTDEFSPANIDSASMSDHTAPICDSAAGVEKNSPLTIHKQFGAASVATSNGSSQGFPSTADPEHATMPLEFPSLQEPLVLPLRPKRAERRPGPSRERIKCPSCPSMIGSSRAEMIEHAKLHPERPLAANLCLNCGICFRRTEDFQHHRSAAVNRGNCGFDCPDAESCSGHHPPSGGIEAHTWLRQAVPTVPKWDFEVYKSDLLRLGETIVARPDDGDDDERWTISHLSLKTKSLRSLISQPKTKRSAPSNTNYAIKLSFSAYVDRIAVFRRFTDSEYRLSIKTWQAKHRLDLALIGAVMQKDFEGFVQIIRRENASNRWLFTAETSAASLRFSTTIGLRYQVTTTLILASEQGFLDGVNLLLCEGADPDTEDENHHTALHWATIRGNWRVCALLLCRGARPMEHKDCSVEMVVALLEHAESQIPYRTRLHVSYNDHGYTENCEPHPTGTANDMFLSVILDEALRLLRDQKQWHNPIDLNSQTSRLIRHLALLLRLNEEAYRSGSGPEKQAIDVLSDVRNVEKTWAALCRALLLYSEGYSELPFWLLYLRHSAKVEKL